ncbi:MAG: YkvA family protein [Tissierellia bacterium]|nr:YkvA family protein [Tissierellia bacterium]MDD4780040.1 YkvA family protein [Tissierellia bacterium]
MNLKERVQQLKKDIPAVFLTLKNKATPWYAKVLAILTISYALSPIDLIPDFVPVLGYLDDIIILPLLVAVTIKLLPKDIIEACRIESEQLWKDGKPKKWYYAMPVVLIWLIIFTLILKGCMG